MLPLHLNARRLTVRFKLFRLILLVSLLALGASMLGNGLLSWARHQLDITRMLHSTAESAGILASAAIAFEDNKAAGEALRILAAQSSIDAAAIYSLQGKRLAAYGDIDLLPTKTAASELHSPEIGLFSSTTSLLQAVLLDGEAIGSVYLHANLAEERRNYLLQVFLAVIASLTGLLLALALGSRFIDRIVKPVKELADTSRQVRERNDYALRAPQDDSPTSPDEITELIESFNAMLAEIEKRDQELSSYRSNLERMVLERTAALHAANREMAVTRDAAEAANRAKSRFLAAASHDLRQPIQAINLFSNALHRTSLNADQSRIGTFISQAAHNLGELLNALLDLSKLDSGTVTPQSGPVDIHNLFSRIAETFSPLAEDKSLRFKLHFPLVDAAPLFTDVKLLNSLLDNLVSNAIKYTERGGILVALRRRGNEALIQVWDSGIGIPQESLRHIFDEYFQVGNPERDNTKGLGLGLSIVRRVAQLLDTRVTCRSRPGAGTVFEFRLPFALPEPQPTANAPAPDTIDEATALTFPGHDAKVIVIEDNAMVANSIKLSLESHGMQVTCYGSAEAALADAQITTANIYISDLSLPGANGIELLDAIRQRAGQPIRAVLLTGDTAPDRLALLSSASWPVIYKPIDLKDLLATMMSDLAVA